MALDMAGIIKIDSVDSLYICLGHSTYENGWEDGITWTLNGMAVENIFVDIRRDPNHNVGLLDRYYIQPGGSPHWVARPIQIDLIEGSIMCCLGHRSLDCGVPGIYTLGMIGSEIELVYIPQMNPFRHDAPPTPTILNVPTGASCISSALITLQNNPDVGSTKLFIAGTDGFYLFTPEDQKENVDSLRLASKAETI
ncbi:uncharacterized protein N7498_005249 [Penicillium cinerascens]|uniref:Uncharacterized protein n=1 Tax=Penicillium cinerascens TaxID=70096 RepID=A0A9W9MNA8_9EURO|nr:uncharacterized protein N7498_005249 [Penicillium cinerascens]KAJ5204370.1 hypothetical protein N7498_005249 [Penicillium cinerascens]